MTEQVIEQEVKQEVERVLLADFLNSVYMVPKDARLYVFTWTGEDWEYWKEEKPTLKREHVQEWDDGIYKVEIRSGKTNRAIYPNVIFLEVVGGEIVRRSVSRPFRFSSEEVEESPKPEPQPTQFTGMEVIAKVLEQQTQILNTLMAMLMQNNQNKQQDDSGMKDIVELYKLKMLKKLEKELLQEDEQIIQMTPEEKNIVEQIYAHIGQGQLGTAIVLWNQLKEKNEALAQTVMANIMDMVMSGQIDLSAIFGQQKSQSKAGNNA